MAELFQLFLEKRIRETKARTEAKMNAQTHWDSLEDFYAGDYRRHGSPEADYGVWWRNERWSPTYRVSYVKVTGEVYAVQFAGKCPVDLLGVVTPDYDDPRGIYYRALDSILDGWADECGKLNGLAWVRQRLHGYLAGVSDE